MALKPICNRGLLFCSWLLFRFISTQESAMAIGQISLNAFLWRGYKAPYKPLLARRPEHDVCCKKWILTRLQIRSSRSCSVSWREVHYIHFVRFSARSDVVWSMFQSMHLYCFGQYSARKVQLYWNVRQELLPGQATGERSLCTRPYDNPVEETDQHYGSNPDMRRCTVALCNTCRTW